MASLGTKAGVVLALYLLGTPTGRLAVRLVASKLGLAAPVKLNKPTEDMHFHGYEFGGPVGSVGMVLGLPVGVFALSWAARQDGLGVALSTVVDKALGVFRNNFALSDWLSDSAINIVLGWFGLQVLLERLLPGSWVDGCTLPPKHKETLKCVAPRCVASRCVAFALFVPHVARRSRRVRVQQVDRAFGGGALGSFDDY
jgi:hypothetical protein